MSGGRARRRKQKAWRRQNRYASLRRSFSVCMNCGEKGAHFVPPSGGGRMPGFFICEKKAEVPDDSAV